MIHLNHPCVPVYEPFELRLLLSLKNDKNIFFLFFAIDGSLLRTH